MYYKIPYFLGIEIKKKLKFGFLNPLLLSIVMTISVLLILNIDYDSYYESAKYISYLLTPATICLAIPLYEQFEILKKNHKAVITGICVGAVTSMCVIFLMSVILGLSHEDYITMLPKSITTAIGMVLSDEMGGYAAITAVVIIITGVFGNVIAESVFKIFHINEPVAKGVALGTSSHAIGTSKALELGGAEGAMSGLSIVIAGVVTVIGMNLFIGLY